MIKVAFTQEHEIFQLAALGALDSIIAQVKADPGLVGKKEKIQQATPLLVAIAYGQLDTVKWLVQPGGADLNAMDSKKNTALILAVFIIN